MKKKPRYDHQTDRERILEHIVCEFASSMAINASFSTLVPSGLIAQMVEHAPSAEPNNIITFADLRPGDLLCCRSVRYGIGVGFFVRMHEKEGLYLLPIGYDIPVWVHNESYKRIMYQSTDRNSRPILPVPQEVFLVGDQRIVYEKIIKAIRSFRPHVYNHQYQWLEFPPEKSVVWVCIREKWKGWQESGYKMLLCVDHPRSLTIKGLRKQLADAGYGDDKKFCPQSPPTLQPVAK